MTRKELKVWAKAKAKESNWNLLGIILLTNVITSLLAEIPLIGFLIAQIITVGLYVYFVNFITDKETKFEQLFSKFSNWKQITLVSLVEFIFVFLWTLLLIVPGIIKAYAYSMVPLILKDEKDMEITEVLKLSEKMMKNHKWDYFVLNLSFFGWHLLSLFTLFIPELWIVPYQQTANIKFLYDIKEQYEKENK